MIKQEHYLQCGKQISQVLKSIMVAETLALVDAAEILFWLSELLAEICSTAEKYIVLPLNCYIEIKQLHKTLHSIHPILDGR